NRLATNQLAPIADVEVFGDPAFRADSFAARGTFRPGTSGVMLPNHEFPSGLRGRVQSWCRAYDAYCQMPRYRCTATQPECDLVIDDFAAPAEHGNYFGDAGSSNALTNGRAVRLAVNAAAVRV